MKQLYVLKTVFALCLFSVTCSQAQTYTLNSSGSGDCGTGGIDGPYVCAFDGNGPATLGTFTDTNVSGPITSMSLTLYDACSGNFEVFVNGVSVGTATTTGTNCSCETIASNINITRNMTVAMTPAISSAYVIGGNNTVTVVTSASAVGAQCFYGALVTVSTTLGMEEFVNKNLKVYPNPASDAFTVSGLDTTEEYVVYNTLGQEILKGTISDNEKINIQRLDEGMYFLKFKNADTIRFTKK